MERRFLPGRAMATMKWHKSRVGSEKLGERARRVDCGSCRKSGKQKKYAGDGMEGTAYKRHLRDDYCRATVIKQLHRLR